VLGKHLLDFRRTENEEELVPEVFLLLVSYFELNPHHYKTEAIFRKAG